MIQKSFQNEDRSSLADKTLALFFTCGMSLEKWEKQGILERELELYYSLAKEFKEILFFSYGGNSEKRYSKQIPQNIRVILRPAFLPSIVYSFLLPLIRWRVVVKADILKTNQMYGSWAAVFTKVLFKKKLAVRCGYEFFRSLKLARKPFPVLFAAEVLEFIAYRSADIVVLTSEKGATFVREHFSFAAKKICVIPNAIDIKHFRPTGEERSPTSVLFVGRLEKVKNVEALVESMEGMEGRLVVVGEGSLRPRLEELARKKRVRAEFRGIVPQRELPRLMNRAAVFVLPSHYENNPKALLEAMACGLPCIATDLPEIREIIRHEENGYLCASDATSIASALRILLRDPQLRARLGERAHETIGRLFSFEKIMQKELELYRRL